MTLKNKIYISILLGKSLHTNYIEIYQETFFLQYFLSNFYFKRTTLARWRAAQEGGVQPRSRRPYLASECEDLREAEKWRNQVISEIARKVSQIQNGLVCLIIFQPFFIYLIMP